MLAKSKSAEIVGCRFPRTKCLWACCPRRFILSSCGICQAMLSCTSSVSRRLSLIFRIHVMSHHHLLLPCMGFDLSPGLPKLCIRDHVAFIVAGDDLTGMQLSGNKVRKLEFLLSEALDLGHDSVITIGGIQSNHARATAVAAKLLGLQCHLILRNSCAFANSDPGLVGNLLVERLAGATLHQVGVGI